MKFVLEIRLGNDAMSTGSHIADALQILADKLEYKALEDLEVGKVFDGNGNSVGQWVIWD